MAAETMVSRSRPNSSSSVAFESRSFARRSDSHSSRIFGAAGRSTATASAFRSITTSAPARTRVRSDRRSLLQPQTRESWACFMASDATRGRRNFSPTSVHERPNTTENRGVPETREQNDSTTCRTRRNLQNLYPRFKSGRRLQSFSQVPPCDVNRKVTTRQACGVSLWAIVRTTPLLRRQTIPRYLTFRDKLGQFRFPVGRYLRRQQR